MKSCNKCKVVRPLSDYYADKRNKSGKQSQCRFCVNKRTKTWYDANKERHKKTARKSHLRRKYKISPETYKEMYLKQQHKCKICEESGEDTLDIDHCHKTGKVRGLLCGKCNKALGLMREDEKYLANMIKYIAYWKDAGNKQLKGDLI